jgi:WD40 repeat protein
MVAVGGELARRRVPMSELEYPESENTRVRIVIQHFSDARLLTNGTDSEGQPYVEPAHDALVRGWQKLLEWKQQDLASLLLQRELTPTVNKWASNRKEKQFGGLLWDDDPRLPLVKQISEQRANWLNSEESEFVRWSIWQKYRNVCLRRLVLGSFLTTAIGAAFFFNYLREVAQLRGDIATAQNLLTTDPTQGLVLAIRSAAQAKSRFPNLLSNAEPTLFNALEASREINIINEHKGAVNSIAIDNINKQIVSASEDGTVKMWDIKGNFIKKLNDDKIPDKAVAFSGSGKYIASANQEGHMCLWDGKGNLSSCYKKAGDVLAFSPKKENLLVTGGKDGKVHLWNLDDNVLPLNKSYQILANDPTPITALAFTHDENIIAIGRENGVTLWNIKTQSISHRLTLSEQYSASGMMLSSLAFSHDDRYLVGGWSFPDFAYEKPKTVLWQLKDAENNDAKPILSKVFFAHDLSANTVVFNPLRDSFVTGGDDNNIQLWDIDGNSIGSAFLGHKNPVVSVAFSQDGKTIISGSEDGTIRFWRTDKTLESFYPNNVENKFAFYSPNCKKIEISKNEESFTWELSQEKPAIFTKNRPETTKLFCSPDGTVIAAIEGELGKKIKIFTKNGNSIGKSFNIPQGIDFLSLNSQGERLVIIREDNRVEVRDFQGKLINKPFPHTGEIRDVVFNSDGRTITTLSLATKGHHVEGMVGIVRLWNIEGNVIYEYKLHFNGELVSYLGTHFLISPSGKGLIYPENIVLPGNMQALMNIACNQLKEHPVFKNPVDIIYKNTARDAKKACEVSNGVE